MAGIKGLKLEFILTLVFASAAIYRATAGDPDITSDFLLPTGTSVVNGTYFTFTGTRNIFESQLMPPTFKVTKATLTEFPALDGLSVSLAILQFSNGSVNPPHTHPRSAELLFLLVGKLEVGFVDTKNNLFTQSLQGGDMFVFPKGLVHFQYAPPDSAPAVAVSVFGSASAGTVSLPNTIFNTSISDDILAKSFKTDVATVQKIKMGLQG